MPIEGGWVVYSRLEARIDLCGFLLQNTTEFFELGSIRRNDMEFQNKSILHHSGSNLGVEGDS